MKLELKDKMLAMVGMFLSLLTPPAAAGSNLWLNLQKPAKNIQLNESDPTKNLPLSGSPVLPSDQSNTSLGGYDPKLENETQDKSYRGSKINSMWMNTEKVKVTRQEFFPRYAGSLGLKLEAGDKIVELKSFVDQSYPDQKDRVMTRYQQSFQAGDGETVPVLTGHYLLIEKDGAVYYAKGEVVSGLEKILPSTKPQHDSNQAAAPALQHVAQQYSGENISLDQNDSPQLLIVTQNGSPESSEAHLVWRILVNTKNHSIWVDVDANTLKIVQTQPVEYDSDFEIKANILDTEAEDEAAPTTRTLRATDVEPHTLTAPVLDDTNLRGPLNNAPLLKPQNNNPVPENNPPPAPETAEGNIACSGVGVFGETWNFKCEKNSGTVTLNCKLGTSAKDCPVQITLYDNITANTQTENSTLDSSYFVDSDSDGIFSDANDTAGVSAAGSLQKAIEIVKNKFKHIGLDGVGKTPIGVYLKDYGNQPNAYYKKLTKTLEFQGKAGEKSSGPFLAFVSIDTIGHELSHGIISNFNPNMNGAYESGSVDEGFADILAEIIEHYHKQESGAQADWKVSPEVYPTTGAQRDFANPKSKGQPSTYLGEKFFIKYEEDCNSKNDWCWRHLNSGPMIHWFYLLAFGGAGTGESGLTGLQKVEGLGIDIAAQIAFATIKRLGPNDGFKETRKASVDAAKDLYGAQSDQVKKVELAWDAVGVKVAKRFSSPPDLEPKVEPWATRIQIEKLSAEEQFEVELGSDARFDEDRQIDMECTDVPMPGSPGKTLCEFKFTLEPDHEYFWHYRPIKSGASPNEGKAPAKDVGLWNNLNLNLNKSGQLDKSGKAALPANLGQEFKDTEWSPMFSFKTDKKMVMALEPHAGAPVNPWKVKFAWKVQTGEVESYRYTVHDEPTLGFKTENPTDQVSDIPSDFTPLHKSRIDAEDKSHQVGDVFSDTAVMPMGKTLYWGVQAFGHNNSFSAIHWPLITFQTDTPKLTLQSPAQDQPGVSPLTLKFAWKPIEGVAHYQLQIAKDPNFTGPLLADLEIPETAKVGDLVAPSPELALPDGKIYWRVYAVGPAPYSESVVSETRSFTVDNTKAKPQLIAPVNIEIPYMTSPLLFEWSPVEGAHTYKLMARDASSADWVEWGTTDHSPVENSKAAENPNGWCWKVIALNAEGKTGVESEPGCFKVGPKPDQPIMIHPGQSAQINQWYKDANVGLYYTYISWKSAYAPNGYMLLVQEHPNIVPVQGNLDNIKPYAKVYVPDSGEHERLIKGLKPNTYYDVQVHAMAPDKKTTTGIYGSSSFTAPPADQAKIEKDENAAPPSGPAACTPPSAPPEAADTEFPYGSTSDAYVGPVTYFKWYPVAGASSYELQVGPANGNYATHSISSSNCSAFYCQVQNTFSLTKGIWHYWRVRAVNKNSCGSTAGPWPDPNNGYNGWTPFAPY